MTVVDDQFETGALVAEHGFSTLLRRWREGRADSILHDAGLLPSAVGHNLDVMGVDVTDLRASSEGATPAVP